MVVSIWDASSNKTFFQWLHILQIYLYKNAEEDMPISNLSNFDWTYTCIWLILLQTQSFVLSYIAAAIDKIPKDQILQEVFFFSFSILLFFVHISWFFPSALSFLFLYSLPFFIKLSFSLFFLFLIHSLSSLITFFLVFFPTFFLPSLVSSDFSFSDIVIVGLIYTLLVKKKSGKKTL